MSLRDPVLLSTRLTCPAVRDTAAIAISPPSGDQAGPKLGLQGAANGIHGADASLVAITRSWLPSAFATKSCDDTAGVLCVRRNAILPPSGDQETGLETFATTCRGVPPRNGTRQTSAGSPLGLRTKSTEVASGVNVVPRIAIAGSAATICLAFGGAVGRAQRR